MVIDESVTRSSIVSPAVVEVPVAKSLILEPLLAAGEADEMVCHAAPYGVTSAAAERSAHSTCRRRPGSSRVAPEDMPV